jgi:opacity protein-like surface antigen
MKRITKTTSKFLPMIGFSALMLGAAQGAMAQSVYGEVGYALMSTKVSVPLLGLSATAKPTMARALVGISPFGGLSIEGIASGSLSDDNFTSTGALNATFGKAEVSQILGLYLGSRLGLGPVEIYGRAGMAKSEVKFNGLGSSDDTDFSYGAGLRLIPVGNFTLSADYMNYLNKGGARIEGYTLSVGYKF